MKYISLAAFIIFTLFTSCGADDDKAESYQQQKQSLLNSEKSNPLRFLKVTSDFKKNLLGKTVVKGSVENTATVASYRNVRLKLLYFNDGKLFENHEDVMTDVLKPGDEIGFKLRYKLHQKADSVSVSVMSADIAD